MDRDRHQLLSGTALAGDQDAGVGPGDTSHQCPDVLDGGALADELLTGLELLPQRPVEIALAPQLERGPEGDEYGLRRERLFEELEGAEPGGLHGIAQGRLAAHHHDGHLGPALGDPLHSLQSAHAWQGEVEQHRVRFVCRHLLECDLR